MELKTIFSDDKKIKVGEREVMIKQVTLGDLPKIVDLVSKVMPTDKKQKPPSPQAMAMDLIRNDFDSVKSVMSSLTDLTPEEVAKLNIAAALEIFGEILKENMGFLADQIVPLVNKLSETMAGLVQSKS